MIYVSFESFESFDCQICQWIEWNVRSGLRMSHLVSGIGADIWKCWLDKTNRKERNDATTYLLLECLKFCKKSKPDVLGLHPLLARLLPSRCVSGQHHHHHHFILPLHFFPFSLGFIMMLIVVVITVIIVIRYSISRCWFHGMGWLLLILWPGFIFFSFVFFFFSFLFLSYSIELFWCVSIWLVFGRQSCGVCQKNFANVYRLQRHMISHDESAGLRKFKCTYCDKAFKFKHHLKVKTMGKDDGAHRCCHLSADRSTITEFVFFFFGFLILPDWLIDWLIDFLFLFFFGSETGTRPHPQWREALRVRQLWQALFTLRLLLVSHDFQKVPHS